MKRSPIPGNKYSEFGPVYSDTTTAAIQLHLNKLIGNQRADMRNNPRYRVEVARLRNVLDARAL